MDVAQETFNTELKLNEWQWRDLALNRNPLLVKRTRNNLVLCGALRCACGVLRCFAVFYGGLRCFEEFCGD